MFVGRIEWTQYKFRGDSDILPPEKYQTLRETSNSQLEELLAAVRANRWAQFREEHRILLWVAAIASACLILAFVSPVFGMIAFFGWVCAASLGLSARSHLAAVGKEIRFLRRSHAIAAQSATYNVFREAYLGSVAKFQLLRRDAKYYAIEMSGEAEREKYAAQNTFIVLGWPAEWQKPGEIVAYPASKGDRATFVKICIHPTNLVRIRLIETSASLKFDSQTKITAETRLANFNEKFLEEFKKWGFGIREAGEAYWPEFTSKLALSPYWDRTESGSFSLAHRSEAGAVSAATT